MSGTEADIIDQICGLLSNIRPEDKSRIYDQVIPNLIDLLNQAVGQPCQEEPRATSSRAAQLAHLLRGHAYDTNEISFRRFASLNVMNILLYEHELRVLDYSYAAHPELLLLPGATENLRKLLADYSTSLLRITVLLIETQILHFRIMTKY